MEVAIWAKNQGPVVLASNIGGFMEQINNRKNGFIFNIKNNKDLIKKIKFILRLPDKQLKKIRLNAYNKVIKERDFLKNFVLFLNSLKF
jgi:glycosyltransferase involved in cell wall biosynthesis